jgi:hypothetical protein
MKILEFKTVKKSSDGRPYLIAFPVDKIEKIESIWGGQNVCLIVNGIEIEGSYEGLIKKLRDGK